MRIFYLIKIDMKKICQFIVNNKQALAVKILLIKSKPFHLSKLTSVLQNILIRQNKKTATPAFGRGSCLNGW